MRAEGGEGTSSSDSEKIMKVRNRGISPPAHTNSRIGLILRDKVCMAFLRGGFDSVDPLAHTPDSMRRNCPL
jgi:hypothetical protein